MSTYTKMSTARRSDDTMDDDTEDKDDTKRKSRNLSEKKRRDQFNLLVNELSSMVSTGARKMDKSTVLRSTISFLKSHNEIAIRSRAHEIQEDWKPAFLSNEEFTHLILEALDGFIVVFSAAGHVHYVSESVTALLGHLPSELLNTSVYELVWDEEQAALYQALVGNGAGNGGTGPDGQLSFQAHLRRGGGGAHQPDGNDTRNDCYELVNFVGYLRTDVDMLESSATAAGTDVNRFSGYSGEADTRLFVGTGRLQTPQLIKEMSLVDAADMATGNCGGALNVGRSNPGEFTSRHSLEWKFLFLDHRAPPIIGYLPFEVLGTSGYDYYHVDDLDQVVSCHEALMQKGEGTSCYYRFLTKGQQWIWLQTRFYITYHQWNSKPEFIVCTHRVVSYVDVMKQSRKKSDDSTMNESSSIALLDSFPVPTSTPPGSGTSSPWGHRGSASSQKGTGKHSHRRAHSGARSDCISTSADSPASRHSQSSQQQLSAGISINSGRTSRLSNHNQQQVPCSSVQTLDSNQQVMFVEPHQLQNQNSNPSQTQYITTIPVQQTVIAGFPAPTPITVLSPLLPTVSDSNTLVLTNASSSEALLPSPTATHLQAQLLQRKHAELQAIIDQQQAELRKVSEQLLMARLGLLATPSTTNQQQQQLMHQDQQHHEHVHAPPQHSMMNYSQQQHQASNSYICNSNVSSTTSHHGHQVPPSMTNDGISQMSVAIPVATHAHAPQHDHLLVTTATATPPHRRQPDESTTMALSQQQAQMLFAAPATNNPEHK